MKRIITIVLAAFFVCGVSASAQARWGVTGGLNFNTTQFTGLQVKAKTGWSLGATCQLDLPFGLSVQPALVYHQKGANITDDISQNMGFLELPVSVQWGPDLLLFRPFIDVTPYIGYALSSDIDVNLPGLKANWETWEGKKRFEYGLGIGGGVNVWRLQVIARYNWNFGSLYNVNGWDDIKPHLKDLDIENENFGGVTLSLAYMF